MISLLKENELDMIRGKMLVNKATQQELGSFLLYVTTLEGLLNDADEDDVFGTEGWRHMIGWD